jgi:hypothetical protein
VPPHSSYDAGLAQRPPRDAPYDEVARYVRPPMGRLERSGDGTRCLLTGTTSNPAMYAGEWLAAIPIPFYAEGGPELRAAMAAAVARLTAALGTRPDNEPSPQMRSQAG